MKEIVEIAKFFMFLRELPVHMIENNQQHFFVSSRLDFTFNRQQCGGMLFN